MTRKIFVTVLLILVLPSVSCGANSDDVYVRKDMLEAIMKNIDTKFDTIMNEMKDMKAEMKEQRKDINELTKTVSTLAERIDGVNKTLNEKIDGVNSSLNQKIDSLNNSLNEKIDGVNKSLSEKIEGVNSSLNQKIDGVDKKLSARMDDLRNGIYLVFTLLSLIVVLPFIRKWYEDYSKQKAEARKNVFNLDDIQTLVKKLIEENNAMLLKKIQGGMI